MSRLTFIDLMLLPTQFTFCFARGAPFGRSGMFVYLVAMIISLRIDRCSIHSPMNSSDEPSWLKCTFRLDVRESERNLITKDSRCRWSCLQLRNTHPKAWKMTLYPYFRTHQTRHHQCYIVKIAISDGMQRTTRASKIHEPHTPETQWGHMDCRSGGKLTITSQSLMGTGGSFDVENRSHSSDIKCDSKL